MRGVIKKSVIKGARVWRAVAGHNTAFERYMRQRLSGGRHRTKVEKVGEATMHTQPNSVVLQTGSPAPKRGIYMVGGCDLPPMFLAAPHIARELPEGSVAMDRAPHWVGSATTSQLLQSFDAVPAEVRREATDRLKLSSHFFDHSFFETDFVPHRQEEFGEFPKSVIMMSIGSDLVRSLHRHREHGFLVDLGGWWLNQSLEKAIKDTETLQWYRANFEKVGKISAGEFVANLGTIADRVQGEIGAHLIVLNTLVIDPLKREHNYQLNTRAHETRKREFAIALAEVSAAKGFHVLDVDRALKGHGVKEATDFAHFPVESKEPVAQEAFRILGELGLF